MGGYARRVSLWLGTHRLGPDNATLSVRTKRVGAAAKAGHDLLIHVTSWDATIVVDGDPATTRLELRADAGSLRVVEGTGGIQALREDDMASIHQTIDDEVLEREEIEFRSTRVQRASGGDRLAVEGELTILGRTNPISFELEVGEDGTVGASAVVTQTAWGIKPYSGLFGALKVHDDVEVALEGHLQAQSR
jgi:polyisoprenoid-binding protein YceI